MNILNITKPKPGILRIIFDTLGIFVFGGWFFGGIAAVILSKPDPNRPPCAGPGPADFGCTGGSEAVIGALIFGVFMAGIFVLFLIFLMRLVNRLKGRNPTRHSRAMTTLDLLKIISEFNQSR